MTVDSQAAAATPSRPPLRGWWVAAAGNAASVHAVLSGGDRASRAVIADNGRDSSFRLIAESDAAMPPCAADDDCGVIFDGLLYNRLELERLLGPDAAGDAAALVLRAYRRWGDDVLTKLRGVFALVIWDRRGDTVLCARDQMGIFPLFYATAGGCTVFSVSSEALVQRPGVSKEPNRGLIAASIARFYLADGGETYYTAVRRVQMGHALRITEGRQSTYRYWELAPPGRPIAWVREDELEQFDVLLDQAVRRCLSPGPAGIFLSGGMDSVSVAVIAAAGSRDAALPPPLAFSIAFPDPDANEQQVQRGVAESLGLPQLLLPLAEASGSEGVLAASIERGAGTSAPLLSPWFPAYERLTREATQRGCRVILTGAGGDEWLTVGPEYVADLIRALDLRGLVRYWQNRRGSYTQPPLRLLRTVFWGFGARPLLRQSAARAIAAIRPGALHSRRLRRVLNGLPAWLAPDPALRRDLVRRAEAEIQPPAMKDFLLQAMREEMNHPLVTHELEEIFERARGLGVLQLAPYLDVDLVDFLSRTPPELLNRGGRSKGLVRQSLARRFPALGFERQKKVFVTGYLRDLLRVEGPPAWRSLGGASSLGALGIVDAKALDASASATFAGPDLGRAHLMWEILLQESWVRPRV